MSLRELAKKLDISAVFLSDVELGGRYPSKRVLTQIAHELDVKLEKLENYDTRPVEEIRRRAQADPAFGLALRKVMDRTIRSWSERNRFKEEMRTFRSKKGPCGAHIFTASASGLYVFVAQWPTPPILYLRFAGSCTDSRPSGSLLLSCKTLSSPLHAGCFESTYRLIVSGGVDSEVNLISAANRDA
jgi:transcriptional regulator with XRE-family HTH domain